MKAYDFWNLDKPCEPINREVNQNEQAEDGNGSDSEDSDSAGAVNTKEEKELTWTEILIEADDDFESVIDKSSSQLEWLRQKQHENQKNEYLDCILSMVGHEHVKAHFLAVKDKVDIGKRCGKSLDDWSYDLVLHGNDGTGESGFEEHLHTSTNKGP
jgi:hypothetical protein